MRHLTKSTVVALAIVAFAHTAGTVAAADKNTDAIKESRQYEIEADQLVSNNKEKYAEFIGNVKAAQGGNHLSSDRLRIYYEGDLAALKGGASSGDLKAKKFVAIGNVRIVSEDYTAVTKRAEYDVGTQIMTLTGADSKVTSGKNSIVGSKITLYQADGQVKVNGESGQRVKAVFFPKGNEIDLFKKSKQKP